jgi:hypothetical protein
VNQLWRLNLIAPPPNYGNTGIGPAKEAKAMKDETAIENEIQAKGLNAPRLTPAAIDAVIHSMCYWNSPGTTLTVCAITLTNGFIVTGESAAASAENFDVEIGKKIAFDNARNKIWALEGYLLKQRLYDAALAAQKVGGE